MRRWLFGTLMMLSIISLLKLAAYQESCYIKEKQHPPLWVELLASAGKGQLGTGSFGNVENQLDLSLLQPGDIMLAGNHGGSYGKYTHCGIYVGHNSVIDMYISTGVYLADTSVYHHYDRAAILRVKSTPKQRQAAVRYAMSQVGEPFFILAPKREDGLWYCSKLIWLAYRQAGIDLVEHPSYWVTPDDLLYSPAVKVVDRSEMR